MTEFRYMKGIVYIFENAQAERVKVGMTINTAADRLNDVNNMWRQQKVTCQICGGRRLVDNLGLVPKHVVSGVSCIGGNAPPLEKSTELASSYLKKIRDSLSSLAGSEKGSAVRKIKSLNLRIEKYQDYTLPEGHWRISLIYRTECAEQVELLSHQLLAEHLDKSAPFGEVFCCDVATAAKAVEKALSKLGLLKTASKQIGWGE